MMNTRGHLSSETIDLLLLSGLDAEKTNAAKAHIDACERCRTRWRELNEDKERFVQYVYPRTVDLVTSRVVVTSWFDRLRLFGPWKIVGPALGAAAAALVAVLVITGGPGGNGGTQSEDEVYVGVKGGRKSAGGGGGTLDIGLKGDPRIDFEVVAQRANEGQFPVKDGTVLRPGDKIRFVVNSGGAKYLLIGSKDGAGNFTVYHPYGGEQSAGIERGQHELPGAIELDEVAGREKLIAVFSTEPLKADEVKTLVEKGQGELKDAKVVSLEFVKGAK